MAKKTIAITTWKGSGKRIIFDPDIVKCTACGRDKNKRSRCMHCLALGMYDENRANEIENTPFSDCRYCGTTLDVGTVCDACLGELDAMHDREIIREGDL